jgi:hypothetical protein
MSLLCRAGGRVPVPLLSPSGVKIRARLNAFWYLKVQQPFQACVYRQIELFCMAGPVLSAASTCYSAGARTLDQLTS